MTEYTDYAILTVESTLERTGPANPSQFRAIEGEEEMSVNMYLSKEVRELPGFKSVPYKDCSGDKMSINGLTLFGDKGRLHAILSDDNSGAPEDLREMVEGYSYHDAIPQMGRREAGIYRHKTAECELSPDDYSSGKRERLMYRLKVTAKNMEDIREIVQLIKTGAIRPEESYEASQSGKSRNDLEVELASLRDRLEHASLMSKRVASIYQFSASLQQDRWAWWPFCRKSTVATRINCVLNDAPKK